MSDAATRLTAALADRYRIERELGQGGMATVYLAEDLKHHRRVAVKVLRPELAASMGPERFLREVETTANLRHPHILPLYDSGEAAGLLFYVMPFVEGESLRDRLTREKQLPVEDAVQIAHEVADALGYAHGHGVVHRDIKPENILLESGHAVVADFGIARAVSAAGAEKLTQTGMAVGTVQYMSPEQAAGAQELDGRSDLYALGCVLYEMLAGEPPHAGPSAQAIIARALTEPPRPIHPVRDAVPVALDGVIAKAMAITPADRFATMADFTRALGTTSSVPAPAGATTVAAPARRPGIARLLSARPLFAIFALGIVVGGGVLFAWRRGRGHETGVRLIAVLPFENQGDSADAYFADGVSDEIRTKLSSVPGMQVIARSSSTVYKNSGKRPEQIAEELGVRYLLTAVVRWEKTAGGASIVHLTPELIEIEGGNAPRSKWGQSFDQPLTNVFQVQADIATQVASALDVALGDSTLQHLAAKPTENPSAYDAFLKGEQLSGAMSVSDPATLRRAAAFYEQATALDPNFALAWAQLSVATSLIYANGVPLPADAEAARHAAERALDLAPGRGEGHLAMGYYYRLVLGDHARALAELDQVQRLAPADASVLAALASTELSLGRTDSAIGYLQRAETLDPRSVITIRRLGATLLLLRRYPEALQATDRARALAPTNLSLIEQKAMVCLAQGDLAGARAAIRAAPREVNPTALVATVATYYDLYWLLDDDQQQLLLRLTPTAFNDNRAYWALALAGTWALRGDQAKAGAYADSARVAFEQVLKASPQDAGQRVLLGQMLAYLNRKSDAIAEGRRAVAVLPISKDAVNGAHIQHHLAWIYILVGEPEKALDQLEPLLKIPYYLSPGWLKVDPTFAPLRGNPRFERLVAGP